MRKLFTIACLLAAYDISEGTQWHESVLMLIILPALAFLAKDRLANSVIINAVALVLTAK